MDTLKLVMKIIFFPAYLGARMAERNIQRRTQDEVEIEMLNKIARANAEKVVADKILRRMGEQP